MTITGMDNVGTELSSPTVLPLQDNNKMNNSPSPYKKKMSAPPKMIEEATKPHRKNGVKLQVNTNIC